MERQMRQTYTKNGSKYKIMKWQQKLWNDSKNYETTAKIMKLWNVDCAKNNRPK